MRDLIISPHVDDEVLGCGGILGPESHVYLCGIDESGFRADKDPTPVEERRRELAAAASFLGFSFEVHEGSRINHYTEQEFINPLEDVINRVRPERVFLPHPGYNQDHRTIHRAALVALRPHDRNFFVRKVLVYEAAHDVIWSPASMNLNCFVPIDIERKIQAYLLHGSQVRGMRSPETLRHIAAVRGAACNADYAEAFEILRWVEA